MARYEPAVLQQFADQLYSRADATITIAVMIGSLGGAFIGYTALPVLSEPNLGGFVGLIVGGLVGNAIGQGRAFQLRVQAQLLLVQLQIEANTRLTTQSTSGHAAVPAARPLDPRGA